MLLFFSISSGCAISWSQRSGGHPKEDDDSGLQIIDDSGKLPDFNLLSSKSGFGTSWLQNAATSSSVNLLNKMNRKRLKREDTVCT